MLRNDSLKKSNSLLKIILLVLFGLVGVIGFVVYTSREEYRSRVTTELLSEVTYIYSGVTTYDEAGYFIDPYELFIKEAKEDTSIPGIKIAYRSNIYRGEVYQFGVVKKLAAKKYLAVYGYHENLGILCFKYDGERFLYDDVCIQKDIISKGITDYIDNIVKLYELDPKNAPGRIKHSPPVEALRYGDV